MRLRRTGCVLAALSFSLLAGCGGSHSQSNESRQDGLRGGVLRVGSTPFGVGAFDTLSGSARYALDPQFSYYSYSFEVFRCCLLRTLLSYNGRSSGEGGGILRPDLASEPPTVSRDGLTWTFHLKRGLHYAPPFERTEITSADIVRALEREFRLGSYASYSFYYTAIAGTKAFADGKAESISGLETPDPHTLVVHLTQPTGDLGYRFSLPATAPIPPGADRGHDHGYGRFLVSSGPYMIAGSQAMDFSLPPRKQRPASGWRYRYRVEHGRPKLLGRELLTLVRNPSWKPSTDALRPAYPDRIEFTMSPDNHRLSRQVEKGSLDLLLDVEPESADLTRYRADRRWRDRLHENGENALVWVTINVAQPPFDDVHVRRALALTLDKEALIHIWNRGPGLTSVHHQIPAMHALPDGLEGGLLAGYDPYAAGRARGDVAAARGEMARSRYDGNHDGLCDGRACRHVFALGAATDSFRGLRPLDAEIARDARSIGITLDIRHLTLREGIEAIAPRFHPALLLDGNWVADFPDGASYAPVLQHPTDEVNEDFSLLGASKGQLRRWGYRARSVPSVNGEIDRCLAEAGEPRARCWATLDQRLMERIIPFVPYGQPVQIRLTSPRVARYSFDQFAISPALDRIALKPELT